MICMCKKWYTLRIVQQKNSIQTCRIIQDILRVGKKQQLLVTGATWPSLNMTSTVTIFVSFDPKKNSTCPVDCFLGPLYHQKKDITWRTIKDILFPFYQSQTKKRWCFSWKNQSFLLAELRFLCFRVSCASVRDRRKTWDAAPNVRTPVASCARDQEALRPELDISGSAHWSTADVPVSSPLFWKCNESS